MVDVKSKFFLLVFVLLFLGLLVVAIPLFVNKNVVLDKREISAFLEIGNKTGLKVENESLDFGRIAYDSNAGKKIEIRNNYNFPIKLSLSSEGNISDFLVYDREIFLDSLEKKEIQVSTIIFTNEPYGNYSGKLVILFEKDD